MVFVMMTNALQNDARHYRNDKPDLSFAGQQELGIDLIVHVRHEVIKHLRSVGYASAGTLIHRLSPAPPARAGLQLWGELYTEQYRKYHNESHFVGGPDEPGAYTRTVL